MKDTVHVRGLSDLQRFLDTLPDKLAKNVVRGGLRAGAKPIAEAARQAAPVGEPSSTGRKRYGLYPGALRDSIRVGSGAKGRTVMGTVKVGGKRKGVNVWYAHLIEFTGAVAHKIKARGKGGLFFGGILRKSVDHPGMKAKPFLRPAMVSQAGAALVATGEYIKARLATKHGIDTSDVVIEEE